MNTPEELYKLNSIFSSIAENIYTSFGLFVSVTPQTFEYYRKYKDLLPFLRNIAKEGISLYAGV